MRGAGRPRFRAETGTAFANTAPQAQRDRPIPRQWGDRRTQRVRLRVPGHYAHAVRRVVGLAGIALALTACGAGTGAVGGGPIVFGIRGGNVLEYRVSIQPNGSVRVKGSEAARRRIRPTQARRLRNEIQNANLRSVACNGVLPDVARRYLRLDGRAVTVHGECAPSFDRVWDDLAQAVGLHSP
jgi:hypothetical protein